MKIVITSLWFYCFILIGEILSNQISMSFLILFLILILLGLGYHYYKHLKLVAKAKEIPIPIAYQAYTLPFVWLIKVFFNINRDFTQNLIFEHYQKTKHQMVQTVIGHSHLIWVLYFKFFKI